MNKLFILAIGACFATAANAYVVYDFEEFAATAGIGGNPGARTSLTSTKSGIDLRLVRSGGAAFDVYDNDSVEPNFHFPLTWDSRSISPFFDATANDYFVGTFSIGMTQVEVEFTDFAGDSDTARVFAYDGANGTGNLVASSSVAWGTNSSPNYVGVAVVTSDAPILSIVFRGEDDGATFPNSMFIDNIAAEPVPEPATLAALGIGAAALLRRRRK